MVEPKFGEASMEERMITHLDEKTAIAKKCDAFIEDGDCIYLDSGSTTYQIAKYIKEKKESDSHYKLCSCHPGINEQCY